MSFLSFFARLFFFVDKQEGKIPFSHIPTACLQKRKVIPTGEYIALKLLESLLSDVGTQCEALSSCMFVRWLRHEGLSKKRFFFFPGVELHGASPSCLLHFFFYFLGFWICHKV